MKSDLNFDIVNNNKNDYHKKLVSLIKEGHAKNITCILLLKFSQSSRKINSVEANIKFKQNLKKYLFKKDTSFFIFFLLGNNKMTQT